MNIIPDLMLEREKLREQIKKWKWLFFLLLIISILVIGRNNIGPEAKAKQDFIARVNIEGVIAYDPKMIKKLNELAENPNVKAVILDIDSPGSTAFAGEELYITLRQLGKKKPVVSVLKTLAASGGYMAALGSEHIIARNMTITGSIGVLWQSFEAVGLADKLGIKFVAVKSSPLKASPNPMEEMTEEAKAALMETIQDNYQVFLAMLMESRKMTKEQAIKLADGRVYSGLKAKELGLVDQIGGEGEALAWLEAEKKIPSKTKIEDVKWAEPDSLYSEFLKFFGHTNSIMSSDFVKRALTQSNISMLVKD